MPIARTRALLIALGAMACSRSIRDAPDASAAEQSYDRYRQPSRVIAGLGLRAGARVADVGAGRGYLTFRLAEAVGPLGRVVATEIDDRALASLRAHTPPAPNVQVRKVAPDEPGLESRAYDLVLLSEVDQYLPDRAQYFAKLRVALAPGGRIAVVNRLLFRAPVLEAAEHAGLEQVGEIKDLPGQFGLLFQPRAIDGG